MKHPNDGIAYAGGRQNATYSLPFGPCSVSPYDDEDVRILVYFHYRNDAIRRWPNVGIVGVGHGPGSP
jgi:hypothetical protein